jgi:hypothetical protein
LQEFNIICKEGIQSWPPAPNFRKGLFSRGDEEDSTLSPLGWVGIRGKRKKINSLDLLWTSWSPMGERRKLILLSSIGSTSPGEHPNFSPPRLWTI